jgi:hypothetical protein
VAGAGQGDAVVAGAIGQAIIAGAEDQSTCGRVVGAEPTVCDPGDLERTPVPLLAPVEPCGTRIGPGIGCGPSSGRVAVARTPPEESRSRRVPLAL